MHIALALSHSLKIVSETTVSQGLPMVVTEGSVWYGVVSQSKVPQELKVRPLGVNKEMPH